MPRSLLQLYLMMAAKLLVISAMIMCAASQRFQTNQTQICQGTCPPRWLATVHGYVGNLMPGNPMCRFTSFMSSCNTPNSPCKPGYSCCPASCLATIVGCYQGPTLQYACLPDDITPWWSEMVQTYMQSNGMGMGMGGGMMGGGMMGGGGGLMGALSGMGGMMGFR